MITPDDELPIDDQTSDDADDQQSQKDIHSNGLDDDYDSNVDEANGQADADRLQQASDASESAYTLNLDDE